MESRSFRVAEKVEVILSLESAAPGPIGSYLAKELEVFDPDGSEECARIRVESSGATSHQPDVVFGVTGGIDDGRFVVPDGAGHWCSFDARQCAIDRRMTVDLDLCCGKFKPTVLLDWLLMPISHFALASYGLVPFHASSARLPDQAGGPVVFSAWSGVGKTNLVLWAMGQGGSFFGDDQVIVDAHARAYPSHRRIAVYGYNRSLIEGLPQRARLKLKLGDSVHTIARNRRGRINYVLAYVANGFGSMRVAAADLGGTVGATSAVSAHVVCRSVSSDGSVKLSEVPRREEISSAYSGAHIAVMEYEYSWFRRFLQTWQWAMGSEIRPWELLSEHWTASLESYFQRVPRIFELEIPRGVPSSVAEEVWASECVERVGILQSSPRAFKR